MHLSIVHYFLPLHAPSLGEECKIIVPDHICNLYLSERQRYAKKEVITCANESSL